MLDYEKKEDIKKIALALVRFGVMESVKHEISQNSNPPNFESIVSDFLLMAKTGGMLEAVVEETSLSEDDIFALLLQLHEDAYNKLIG